MWCVEVTSIYWKCPTEKAGNGISETLNFKIFWGPWPQHGYAFGALNSFLVLQLQNRTLRPCLELYIWRNEDANEPIRSEDVAVNLLNYEDNEFDESSDEEVRLNEVTDDTTSDDLYQQDEVERATNFMFGARSRYIWKGGEV